MKLHEVTVIGDDGGFHRHLHNATQNMERCAKKYTGDDAKLCVSAVSTLSRLSKSAKAFYDDPHTLLRVLSHFQAETPDFGAIRGAIDTIASYSPSDSD